VKEGQKLRTVFITETEGELKDEAGNDDEDRRLFLERGLKDEGSMKTPALRDATSEGKPEKKMEPIAFTQTKKEGQEKLLQQYSRLE